MTYKYFTDINVHYLPKSILSIQLYCQDPHQSGPIRIFLFCQMLKISKVELTVGESA